MNVQQDGCRLNKKDVKVLLYMTITRIVTGFKKVWRYQRGNDQKPYIEAGQTIQWPKEKEGKKNDLQNTTQKTEDLATLF